MGTFASRAILANPTRDFHSTYFNEIVNFNWIYIAVKSDIKLILLRLAERINVVDKMRLMCSSASVLIRIEVEVYPLDTLQTQEVYLLIANKVFPSHFKC